MRFYVPCHSMSPVSLLAKSYEIHLALCLLALKIYVSCYYSSCKNLSLPPFYVSRHSPCKILWSAPRSMSPLARLVNSMKCACLIKFYEVHRHRRCKNLCLSSWPALWGFMSPAILCLLFPSLQNPMKSALLYVSPTRLVKLYKVHLRPPCKIVCLLLFCVFRRQPCTTLWSSPLIF